MFQSIKDALAKNEGDNANSNTSYNEIMKTSPGHTYTVRLLPFAKDPKNTFFHYYNHGWQSFATGQYVQSLSPMTFGERDPIAEERFKILRTGSEDEKEKVKAIKRIEKYLVNVYVIDDPQTPENNGKVKMLRYGKQLHKIIMEAIEGEDSEEFGPRIFDLGTTGVSFKIKCENQGEFPTYVSSRFTSAGKLALSEDEQKKIYDSAFDLTKVFSLKSYDELKQMLDEHYYCKSTDKVVAESQTTSTQASGSTWWRLGSAMTTPTASLPRSLAATVEPSRSRPLRST
jgi:hypothetical protein